MRVLRDKDDLDPAVADRILGQNACDFYAIDVAD